MLSDNFNVLVISIWFGTCRVVSILGRVFTCGHFKDLFHILRENYTRLVSSGVSLTSWGEGASLALVGHPSSDGVTIKMPYGVDVLHRPASHPIFSYWVG